MAARIVLLVAAHREWLASTISTLLLGSTGQSLPIEKGGLVLCKNYSTATDWPLYMENGQPVLAIQCCICSTS